MTVPDLRTDDDVFMWRILERVERLGDAENLVVTWSEAENLKRIIGKTPEERSRAWERLSDDVRTKAKEVLGRFPITSTVPEVRPTEVGLPIVIGDPMWFGQGPAISGYQ